MIQAAQDTPAPDEVRPQNPEALARLIMEQLPQKKGSLVNLIMGVFGGGGASKPKAAKAGKAEKPTSIKGGGAVKEKPSKFKNKGNGADREAEQDRRPGGVTFGRKKDDYVDNEAIESQVGTFSRLKSISHRTPEQLDREAQSTTRSLGEKFGMAGANTILDEGPLTLAESIKRKVSESQKLSPLDDDPDASGSLVAMNDNLGPSPYARAEAAGGDNWGPPSFAGGAKPPSIGGPESGMDWGGGAHVVKAPSPGTVPAFAPNTPVGLDEHPGSSIGLAPPGSKRPMTSDQPNESAKAGIGLAPAAPSAWTGGAQGATPSTAGGGGGWGASDTSQSAADAGSSAWGGTPTPAQPAPAAPAAPAASGSGWTSGWGGDGAPSAQVPLKSSDSWAIPGAEGTNSWGQPGEAGAANMEAPAEPAQKAAGADPWAPPSGSWGGSEPTPAPQPQASENEAWGATAPGAGSASADPWGTPAAPSPSQEMTVPTAQPQSSNDAWGAAVNTPQTAAPASADPWGAPAPAEPNFAPAPAAQSSSAWGSQPDAAPAPAANDAWGAQPAPAPAPAANDAWGAQPAPAPAPAANDAWGAQPAPAPAPAANDAWGAQPAPAPASNDAWGDQPAPAPASNDAWGAQPAPAPAPASNDAWGGQPAPAPAPASNDAWGGQPAQAQAPAAEPAATAGSGWGTQADMSQPAVSSSDSWGAVQAQPEPASAPAATGWGTQADMAQPQQPAPASDGWGAAAAQPAWGAAPAQPAATSTGETAAQPEQWGQGQPVVPPPDTTSIASGYSTIPPGQFATPAAAGSAIASSGWGQTATPLDNSQIEAKKNAWAAEAEQLETGTWKAFAPKMNEGLGGKAPAMPAVGQFQQPQQPPSAAPAGERWDVPIQERAKTQIDQPIPAFDPNMGQQPQAQPMAPAINPIQAPGQAAAPAARWDVPIQERPRTDGDMAAPPAVAMQPPLQPQIGMPPGAAGSPVLSSGIPVNQIVEKMGQVLGGTADGQESRWDVPIQERVKSGQVSQEMQPVAAQAPAPQPASTWGQQPAFEAPAAPAAASDQTGWGAATAAPAANNWGQEAAPASGAPAASSWSQPATSSWGDAPAVAAVSQQNPVVSQSQAPVSSGWGNVPENAAPAGGNSWGQAPAAPAANTWASAPQEQQAPPPPPPQPMPSVKPEITDKVAGGGLLSGIDDRAIDKIFGEIGVQESVSKTVVNSGGEPVSNFSPPQGAEPQPMTAPQAFAQPPAQTFAQPAAPEQPKGLLGGIDDNAIDRIFSQNLGVSEPSVPVGNGGPGMAAPASGNWAQPPVAAPAPTPPTAAETAQSSGWGAPASSGWGTPPAMSPPPAPEPAATPNSGWGTPPAATSQWGQGAPNPVPVPVQAPEAIGAIGANGQPKLFSVDDSVMDRIFSENLGIPGDRQPAANAGTIPSAPQAAPVARPSQPEMAMPAAPFTSGPPPKIEGIGRLDAGADPNQDTGSGRIASIGKFLLDQKDLDKIGKLTNTDNNEGKLRILTKENSDDLQALLGQIGTQKGVIGSVIVGHDGLLIANTMPSDMDAESVGVWALGVYMNTEHVTKKMGHDRVHQVVSRTPRGYVIIADFGGGLLVTVTEGKDTDSLIPLMRTITQLVN